MYLLSKKCNFPAIVMLVFRVVFKTFPCLRKLEVLEVECTAFLLKVWRFFSKMEHVWGGGSSPMCQFFWGRGQYLDPKIVVKDINDSKKHYK